MSLNMFYTRIIGAIGFVLVAHEWRFAQPSTNSSVKCKLIIVEEKKKRNDD